MFTTSGRYFIVRTRVLSYIILTVLVKIHHLSIKRQHTAIASHSKQYDLRQAALLRFAPRSLQLCQHQLSVTLTNLTTFHQPISPPYHQPARPWNHAAV
ncbi:MAG: hypothetical protein KDD89_01505 [Anaerolineales bacterium]|nr:hypothetical protein [Anaerolineales bacterium]